MMLYWLKELDLPYDRGGNKAKETIWPFGFKSPWCWHDRYSWPHNYCSQDPTSTWPAAIGTHNAHVPGRTSVGSSDSSILLIFIFQENVIFRRPGDLRLATFLVSSVILVPPGDLPQHTSLGFAYSHCSLMCYLYMISPNTTWNLIDNKLTHNTTISPSKNHNCGYTIETTVRI